MKKILHHAEARGSGEHGWLSTRYSFSFSDWYEPSRMGYGALRVLNDDTIAPASGFPMHGHKDMEIITIVTRGAVTHKDSLGNVGVVPAGDVQAMSAGTGVVHAEFNASATEPLSLFQLWIVPNVFGAPPRYAQKSFANDAYGLTLLVGPDGSKDALPILQEAYIYRGRLDATHPISYALPEGRGAYVFVVDGAVTVAGEMLRARDAIGVSDTKEFVMETKGEASVLVIETPLDA